MWLESREHTTGPGADGRWPRREDLLFVLGAIPRIRNALPRLVRHDADSEGTSLNDLTRIDNVLRSLDERGDNLLYTQTEPRRYGQSGGMRKLKGWPAAVRDQLFDLGSILDSSELIFHAAGCCNASMRGDELTNEIANDTAHRLSEIEAALRRFVEPLANDPEAEVDHAEVDPPTPVLEAAGKRFTVTLQPPQATLDGTAYSITPDAATFLDVLVRAKGEWVSGSTLPDMRADRVRKHLPQPIQVLIEARTGVGFRLQLGMAMDPNVA
jgi:hypothetical protein